MNAEVKKKAKAADAAKAEKQIEKAAEAAPAEATVTPVPEASLKPEDAQVVIHQHFLNDLSIENPAGLLDARAAEAKLGQKVRVEVAAREGDATTFKAGEPTHQVTVGLQLSAHLAGQTIYLAEMRYRALVEVRNLVTEDVEPALFVTVPSAMFPALKEVMERNGSYAGYPGLTVQPIDFAMIHDVSKQQQAATATAAAEAEGKTKH